MFIEFALFALVSAVFTVRYLEKSSYELVAVFVMFTLSHSLLDKMVGFTGYGYYFSAAMFDLGVIITLNHMMQNKTSYYLQIIALISIVLNFLGWLLWFFYFPPIAYDIAFLTLYIITVLVILRRGLLHGVFTIYQWCANIRANHSKSNQRDLQKEVTT